MIVGYLPKTYKEKIKMKKIFAILISAVLLLCLMSVSAFALVFDFEDTTDISPVVDGAIGDGEYAWTSDALDKLVTFYNEFYVVEEHDDGVALTVEYLLDTDDTGLYIAVSERTTGYTNLWCVDLVFCTADGLKDTMTIDMEFVRDNSLAEAYAPIYNQFLINGEDAAADLETYVAEGLGYYFDDGLRNNNYVELKLDKAAIEELVGDEIVGFGIRMVTAPGEDRPGLVIYGDEESEAYPTTNSDFGYHFFALEEGALDNPGTPTETEPTETEPAETEPTDTEPAETDPVETTPTETEPTETEPTEDEILEEKGCGASVAAIAVALVATLGTCTAFVIKK